MSKPMEMPFGWVTLVNPTNHRVDGVEICTGMGNFGGLSGPFKSIIKYSIMRVTYKGGFA